MNMLKNEMKERNEKKGAKKERNENQKSLNLTLIKEKIIKHVLVQDEVTLWHVFQIKLEKVKS